MVSKGTSNYKKSHDELEAWFNAQKAELIKELKVRLGPNGDAEPLIAALMAYLQSNWERLVAAENAHQKEQDDDVQPRQDRDTHAQALYRGISELRNLVEVVFGKNALPLLSLTNLPSRDPDATHLKAEEIVKSYQAGIKLPAPLIPGAKVDIREPIANLEKTAQALKRALKEVKREEGEFQVTKNARLEALEYYEQAFSGLKNIFYGMTQIAGKKAVGDLMPALIRPRRRGPNGEEVEEDEEEESPAE